MARPKRVDKVSIKNLNVHFELSAVMIIPESVFPFRKLLIVLGVNCRGLIKIGLCKHQLFFMCADQNNLCLSL